MGGHGGLNILPQKSWNVYGRENRLKVARDEAKHAEEETARLDKQRQAEGEVRRRYLLLQAQRKSGVSVGEAEAALAGAQAAALHVARANSSGAAAPAGEDSAALVAVEQGSGLLQHINFFQEHEARDQHPEVQEEKRQEKRRRGDEATQTSDARFDEGFALAHGLTGRAAQPWYSRRGSTLPSEDRTAEASLGGLLGWGAAVSSSQGLLLMPGQPCAAAGAPRLERPSKAKKERQKKHKKKLKKGKEGRSDDAADKAARLAALREERGQREAAEAARTRALLFASQEEAGVARGGKRYHGAYRAPLPRRPHAAGSAL
ncbi:hypothetical protein WJX81_005215 [Elliptochloris bilobata]|uniref:CBF1-interacting co-repressor CIR N-terminal domain-containing protein n=1 Tax=Elliptochloris bilobata TaxID=381761 RepID=A0AAW1QY44_9CHLO